MKRVIVVSDSHGNKEGISKIINNFKFDYFIFLGDCLPDLGCYANLENVLKVRGNCDFFSNAEDYDILNVEGFKIFFCHGDAYSVKRGTENIFRAGKLMNANIVLYGHTHKYAYEVRENIHLINCPALSCVRGGENSFLILELDNKKISILKQEF